MGRPRTPRRICLALAIGFALLGCTRSAPAPIEDPPGLGEAREWIVAGRYADAEARAREVLATAEADHGPDSSEAARACDVLVESLWRAGRSREDGVLELAERALSIKEERFGARDRELAPSLRNLAIVFEDRRQPERALPLYEQALDLQRRSGDPADVARALSDLGNLMHQTRRLAEARPFYDEALTIQIRALGEQHVDVARTLNNLGLLHREMGEWDDARRCYERALAIREAAQADSLDVAWTLNSLAILAVETGAYDEARAYHERTLSIRRARLGAEHPHVAWTLMNLGTVHRDTGNYVEARRFYEQALAMQEKLLGAEHLDTVMTRANLAELHRLTGDLNEARKLHESVLATRSAAAGAESDMVGTSSLQLCRILVQLGDVEGARSGCERAARIWEGVYGTESAEYALAVHGLGSVAEAAGDLAGARTLLARSLEIREKVLGAEHPDVAASLLDLGRLDMRLGDLASARTSLEQSRAVYETVVGPAHPAVGGVLEALARTYARSGDRQAALDSALHAERIGVDHVRLTAPVLAEREVLNYASARATGLDVALSLAADGLDPAATERVFDLVIRSRALVLDEMARRNTVVRSTSDPDLARLAEAVTRARRRLANVTVRGPDPDHPERYRSLVEAAAAEKESAERALAERSSSFRAEASRAEPGFAEVSRALPRGFALVAYVRYERSPFQGTATVDVPAYLAFVLRAGAAELRIVPLGPADAIDIAVAAWREHVTHEPPRDRRAAHVAESACRRAGEKLRELIWDPVASGAEGARGLIVVPDGALHLVNLSALPAADERYLIETAPTLHLVSAERDVVEPPEKVGSGLLAIGGPDFGPHLRVFPAAASDFRALVFEPLPGAAAEVEDVVTLWNEAARGTQAPATPALELRGEAATEDAFKQAAAGRRVVHLATHGFFLERTDRPSTASLRGISGLVRDEAAGESPSEALRDNPLVLSGLALAGANRRGEAAPEAEDGVLTAEEIAGLDLHGLEWAVLSACDTGRGALQTGEGVLGLRRAFQIAGARTVIMSLWPVGDEMARAWMGRLYRGRFKERRSSAEAVREAGLGMLRERRAEGAVTHPFYWGAFVASGDWR